MKVFNDLQIMLLVVLSWGPSKAQMLILHMPPTLIWWTWKKEMHLNIDSKGHLQILKWEWNKNLNLMLRIMKQRTNSIWNSARYAAKAILQNTLYTSFCNNSNPIPHNSKLTLDFASWSFVPVYVCFLTKERKKAHSNAVRLFAKHKLLPYDCILDADSRLPSIKDQPGLINFIGDFLLLNLINGVLVDVLISYSTLNLTIIRNRFSIIHVKCCLAWSLLSLTRALFTDKLKNITPAYFS